MHFSEILHPIESLLGTVSGFIWGYPLMILLFGTHLYLTFRLRFIQRYTGKAIKLSVARDAGGQGDVSQFGALTTALAATIGTGNIIGVGTAVAMGGPGAVLWMWLTGVFGIATKYAEALLAVKYRTVNKAGQMAGGPMYVLERGLNMRWLGIIFAVLTAIAAFGIGNMTQANSITKLAQATFAQLAHIPNDPGSAASQTIAWITGVILMVLTAVVILGGIRSIARVCEGLVPFMAIFYVLGCIILLFIHFDRLPETIVLILKGAFTPRAAAGGFAGFISKEALKAGLKRGLFSNESGLGSAPIVAAAAQTRNPVRQALVSSTGTFWDTVVVCLMTGLVLVNSGYWNQPMDGTVLTHTAFGDIHWIGQIVLTVGLLTFVFSTILGWSYYGEKAAEYLFGTRAVKPYRYLWVIAVLVGSVSKFQAVWDFADIANGLMAIPNLISLIALTGVIVAETRKYLWSGNLDESGE